MLSLYDICKFLKHKVLMPILSIPHLRLIDKRKYEELERNFEALKSMTDVRTLKPATGSFRELQLKNLEFTKEIVSKLEQNGFNLIMTSGTLLGAERHGGFIPWDDDIDFMLMRSDFERLREYAQNKYKVFYQISNKYFPSGVAKQRKKELLEQYPNQVIMLVYPDMYKFIKGISIDNYVQFDVFAYDYYDENLSYEDYIACAEDIKQSILWKIDNTEKIVLKINDFIKKNTCVVEKSNKISYGIANPGSTIPSQRTDFWTNDDYFPLKRMKFEGVEFWAPNNHIKVLDYWCKHWREVPNSILPPHESERKGS